MKKKSATFTLGRWDCAVVIRCKTFKGPVRHELLVPKANDKDQMPVSTNDLLACAMLFGKGPLGKELRATAKKSVQTAVAVQRRIERGEKKGNETS